MKSSKTTLIIVLLVLFAATAGIIIYIRKKGKKNGTNTTSLQEEESTDENPFAPVATPMEDSFPLTFNESLKSDTVKECQKLLNFKLQDTVPPYCPYAGNEPVLSLKEDGYFGKQTAAVVKWLYPLTDGKIITLDMYNELKSASNYGFKFSV